MLIHGSAERAAELFSAVEGGMAAYDSRNSRDYHGIPINPSLCRTRDTGWSNMKSHHGNRVSTRLPSLTEAGAETGVPCRPCQAFFDDHPFMIDRLFPLKGLPP